MVSMILPNQDVSNSQWQNVFNLTDSLEEILNLSTTSIVKLM